MKAAERRRVMPQQNSASISEGDRARSRTVFWCVTLGAITVGFAAAWYYHAVGLTLSHYDARAHLVVARRVADSLTPGWRQFGGTWLPLPHVLNALPVQLDWAYQTGLTAVTISGLVLAFGLGAFARMVFVHTRSLAAACSTPLVVMLNPNVLYLQSTPMTEPLLAGLSLAALGGADTWLRSRSPSARVATAWVIAALVMTRYEGWLIAAALIVGTSAVSRSWRTLIDLGWPGAVSAGGFLALGWAGTGQWFLKPDFFVSDPELLHNPGAVGRHLLRGAIELGGWPLLTTAGAGAIALFLRRHRERGPWLTLALAAALALPFAAFYLGHPFRVRYLTPAVLAGACLAAWAIAALPRRIQAAATAGLMGWCLWVRPPLDAGAAMVQEAQWETPYRLEREAVTDALRRRYDGSPILASMGSLAHYMQETSAAGFTLRSFLHEGNGDLWAAAIENPGRVVRWVLVEERAEGGDLLAQRARADGRFLEGFERIAEGGGLALYGRSRTP